MGSPGDIDPPEDSGTPPARPRFAQRSERPREGGAWLLVALLAISFPAYWGYRQLTAGEEPEAKPGTAGQQADVLAVADDYAATLFADQKWEEAAKAYRILRERYLEANSGEYDESAGALHFNEAASEMNRGKNLAARTLLLDLARELPSYRPEEISGLIREASDRSRMERYEQLSEAASLAFDQAAWSVAIERYQEVLDHLRSLGYAQGDDLLSQTLYDQAMAYWNDEQYANAERLLGRIRIANPDYDAARIEDQHQQVIAILREQ